MLVQTVIDPDGIADAVELEAPIAQVLHEHLLQTLYFHCVLMISNADEHRALIETISSLPPAIRERWMATLPMLRRRECSIPIAIGEVFDLVQLRESYAGRAELIGCERTRAGLLGVDQDISSYVDSQSGIEISRLDVLPNSTAIKRVAKLAHEDIQAGTNRSDVWRERFGPLASGSVAATIVDRYALNDIQRGTQSGIGWFLAQLDRSGVRTVHLICGDKEQDLAAGVVITRAMLKSLPVGPRTIDSIELVIAEDKAFYKAHGRYVRFDECHALMIEPGLGVFGHAIIRQGFPCPLVEVRGQLSREKELRTRVCKVARISRD